MAAKAKKKAEEPPAENGKVDNVESDIARILSGEETSKDKVESVLDELRAKSSEIVVRGLLAKMRPTTMDDACNTLNAQLGLDGWQCDVQEMGHHAAKVTLSIRIAGQWVKRFGVGMPIDGEGTYRERLSYSIQEAFASALYGFGVYVKDAETPAANAPGKPAIHHVDKPAEKPKDKPREKTTEEVRGEQVKDWTQALAGVGSVDDLNDLLPKLKSTPEHCKQEIWDMIRQYAKQDALGWRYDKDQKKFYDPNPPQIGDAIPF